LRPRGPLAGARTEQRPLSWPEATSLVEARLAARFPGLLFDRLERSFRALIPAGEGEGEALEAVRAMDWGGAEGDAGMSVGVSNACTSAAAVGRGFEEAEAAAEVGGLIRGSAGVTTYEDLGPYRYVLRATAGIRDRFQDRLERLVEYDTKRSAHLLDTLEAYLDHRSNVVATSRDLYIHPNTLRQRLARIERLSGLDLEHDDWLSLAVAAKVVKLRRMRTNVREEGR